MGQLRKDVMGRRPDLGPAPHAAIQENGVPMKESVATPHPPVLAKESASC
jgi:hypothetical protein